jgi:hypothetical protein
MGLKAQVSGSLEVLAAEPFSLSLIPTHHSIRQNDAVQSVSYRVLFDRSGGFAGNVYLKLVGMVGDRYQLPEMIPAGESEVLFTIDTEEHPVGDFPFMIEGYEDPADIPSE